MGDLLAAAPVIGSRMRAGDRIILLVFPQIAEFAELLDFRSEGDRLRILKIAPRLNISALRNFMREASLVSPDVVWLSPHTPIAARSWKIPLSIWIAKKLYWRSAKLVGATTERLSWLFDQRIPVERRLPLAAREHAAYGMFDPSLDAVLPAVSFKRSLLVDHADDPEYDLLIFPGASAANRKWPLNNYEELLRRLPVEWKVAICAVAEDVEVLRRVVPDGGRVELLQVPLIEALRRMARSRGVFCMDSGPVFFAQALGVPAVAMYGAVDPANVISTGIVRPIYEKRWSCQPCGSAHCIQGTPYCIASISPSRVLAEVSGLLQRENDVIGRRGH
jgi:ADP-heptose:LPS heptosyltransferase